MTPSDLKPNICMVGSCMVDLISRVPRLPAPGETLIGSSFQIGFGGKGANQAVMAARLGAAVSVVVSLGRDVFGENTLKNFQEQGIDTRYLTFDEQRFSGVAPIAVDEHSGQNSIIIVPGANDGLTPEKVQAASAAIHAADVLICQCEIPVETTLAAFRVARERSNTLTILNPAPAPQQLPEELMRLCDLFVPNETEAAHLTGLPVETLKQAAQAAYALQEQGPRQVIITLGARGALVLDQNHPVQHIAAEPVRAIDTTGAGDAFVGSLAYFLGKHFSLEKAVVRACAIATRSVLKTGTQISFPYRSEVLELLD
jgi:ribokinase